MCCVKLTRPSQGSLLVHSGNHDGCIELRQGPLEEPAGQTTHLCILWLACSYAFELITFFMIITKETTHIHMHCLSLKLCMQSLCALMHSSLKFCRT